MFLSDQDIRNCLQSKKIIVLPSPPDSDIRPVGIRVHLANKILIQLPNQIIDLENPAEIKYKQIDLNKNDYLLKPGEFVLASTKQKIQLSRDLVGFIDGRSTMARLGITIHLSSTTADGLYDEPQTVTLEMKNLGNLTVKLIADYPVGMLTISKLDTKFEQSLQSQYRGQTAVTAPNLKFKPGSDL